MTMPPGLQNHGHKGPFGGGGPFGGNPAGAPVDHSNLFWIHDLFVLAFLIVVVVGIVLLVRHLARRPRYAAMAPMPTAAVTELDMRYARGEVDRDEFLRRRADLLTPNYYAAAAPAAPSDNAGAEEKPKKG
jgi:putative membrane protein